MHITQTSTRKLALAVAALMLSASFPMAATFAATDSTQMTLTEQGPAPAGIEDTNPVKPGFVGAAGDQPDIKAGVKYNKARKYILGPNDVLSISVLDFPEYSQTNLRVQPDGNIYLAGIGPMNVSGMTVEELYNALLDEYKHSLKNPKLTINLDKMKPFIVYVNGSVLNPGSFELDTDTAKAQIATDSTPEVNIERKTPLLSNILVAAGGVTYTADIEHVRIVNKLEGSDFTVNLLDLITENDTTQDIFLMPGDTVEVPELPIARAAYGEDYKKFANATFSQRQMPVRVYGYVNTPGLVRLDTQQSNRLNSAISAAGGYRLESASAPDKVFVTRTMEGGKLATLTINPNNEDIALLPNDVVYVPEKARPKAVKVIDFVTRLIVPANTIAQSYNNWAMMFNPTRQYVTPRQNAARNND